jgi:long-chain acyl-CoA synthetase
LYVSGGKEEAMSETIPRLFLHLTKSYPKPDMLLYKKDGRYVPISTEEFRNKVSRLALGLQSLGVRTGDKIILLADNSPDWTITDYAVLSLGGITVPVYTSLVPEQIKYIINDSDAKVVVVSSPKLWEKVQAIKKDLPQVKHFITFESQASEGLLTQAAIQEVGEKIRKESPDLFENLALAVKPDDIASIIYTSGTTGTPKGVMLTHGNFVSNVKTLASIIEFNEKDTSLSFLPISHVLERLVIFAFLSKGVSIAYAKSVETVADNLVEVRPSLMVSVPRLFEKIYAKVMDTVLAGSSLKKKIFFWAIKVGREYREKSVRHLPVSASLRWRAGLAHKLVFSKILEKTGGRVKFFVSGGAPLSKEIAEFFFALGLVVLEGYGLTESSPVIAVNTFENLKFGTVGKPIPGVEVKIAADGEILARGPNIMKGYYNKDDETREALAEGWLHTGDIGHLDKEGFLVITDRKKDLIVTSGGKNIAPQPIENLLKQNPYILNAVVVGGNRKFVAALIVPNFEKLESYARLKNIPFANQKDLIQNEAIIQFMREEVSRTTPHLAPYEKVKRIALLDRDFEIERGEMTPTLKVKRSIVEEKYRDLIDSLYNE